jgi:hypothetical protein
MKSESGNKRMSDKMELAFLIREVIVLLDGYMHTNPPLKLLAKIGKIKSELIGLYPKKVFIN